ncbi:putative anthocyanidin reductase [Lolium rigidum]|uniref:putative anthocyanidin reductase n=1 Tax=Lolium rigidum TaxID=89674 RepID=UPI001F5DD4F1|nr:putative anthocyanidin reductase [Lolium rigidum]
MMSRVCVTGAAGYIAAWLVKKLLERGFIVHATLRNLRDEKKTALLKALPGAAERLTLFQADVYDAATFEPAIQGCEFVFLIATPLLHDATSTKYKNITEAIVDAHRMILQQCERSKTVRRVIHTASCLAASPLKEDGDGYKDFVNESCWSPLNVTYGYSNFHLDGYVTSKSLSEKELLRYNEKGEDRAFEVVTLACGLVGGDTIQPILWSSIPLVVSPLTGNEAYHNSLKFMQAVMGSVPLVDIEDVCDAHIFCMEQPAMAGRFLCIAGYPTMQDYVARFATKHPEHKILLKKVVGEGVRVQGNTNKLGKLGFRYRYGVEETLDRSVECAKRLGEL